MFENILHQPQVKSILSQDMKKGIVPPSILFWGPQMSGKLSTALELARVLSCTVNGDWVCSCEHCNAHRSLYHTRTLIAGKRSCMSEIRICADIFLRDPSDGCRYLFLRSVHKLLRRLDPPLWEGEYSRISRNQSTFEKVAGIINDIIPGRALPVAEKLENQLENLVRHCEILSGLIPDMLPVWQVRNITNWARHSVKDDHKTIIIDSADCMTDAARNALLKFLEEPPGNTTVILLARRKNMLIPTILSRLRPYAFHNRLIHEQQDILKKIFRVEAMHWKTLADFFAAWENTDIASHVHSSAAEFIDRAWQGHLHYSEMINSIATECEMNLFLGALTKNLRERWLKDSFVSGYRKWAEDVAAIRRARYRHENLNISSLSVLRGLYSDLGTST